MTQQSELSCEVNLLKGLFLKFSASKEASAPTEQTVREYFENAGCDINLDKIIRHLEQITEVKNPYCGIQLSRQLLALILMRKQGEELQVLVKKYSRFPYWKEFQLAEALNTLNHLLTDLPFQQSNPKQLASGAVPLEWGGHWTWAECPHNLFHAELGIYWYMLGELTSRNEYTDAANRLTEWQQNILDYDSVPFSALFAKEQEGGVARLLPYHYLLFRTAHMLGRQSHMGKIADRQAHVLMQLCEDQNIQIPSHLVMIEQFVSERGASLPSVSYALESTIQDSHTCLIGLRNQERSVVCTQFGGKTGLGAYRNSDVEVVTYGPQHLPLGDSENFGIEGGEHSQNAYPYANMQCGTQTFSIASHARVASKEVHSDSWPMYGNGKHSQTWIDIRQQFSNDSLSIEAQFLGVDIPEELAFSLYVKAEHCRVGDIKELQPCTFERYEGDLAPISLFGEQGKMQILSDGFSGSLQVIPLSGGDSFWGADFLIAFVNPGKERFTITISSRK